ncbi:hypothetical protein COO60DRAFT_176352 [Scenedesmus sp. NREL 46B-D3]|nr:hypothetical protein COO60DRAFT_176352 [Scenedesmus sp. NREL 46B-D3]
MMVCLALSWTELADLSCQGCAFALYVSRCFTVAGSWHSRNSRGSRKGRALFRVSCGCCLPQCRCSGMLCRGFVAILSCLRSCRPLEPCRAVCDAHLDLTAFKVRQRLMSEAGACCLRSSVECDPGPWFWPDNAQRVNRLMKGSTRFLHQITFC